MVLVYPRGQKLPQDESTADVVCCFRVQVLQESLSIPGTDIYLVYRSSQTSGYMSTILIQLTPDHVPEELAIVRLRVIVEGLVFERVFEADPNLRYRFTWDRRNAYNQKVYGIVTANGEMSCCCTFRFILTQLNLTFSL